MDFTQQNACAVVETDHDLSMLERERILADLSSIGIRAVLLPVGVSLSHVAMREMDEDE